jgi:hypothetical protein
VSLKPQSSSKEDLIYFSLVDRVVKDRIGDVSIKLQFGSEENWTRALRHVLLNVRQSFVGDEHMIEGCRSAGQDFISFCFRVVNIPKCRKGAKFSFLYSNDVDGGRFKIS